MSVLMRVILCRDMDEGVKQIYRGIFIPSPFSTALFLHFPLLAEISGLFYNMAAEIYAGMFSE